MCGRAVCSVPCVTSSVDSSSTTVTHCLCARCSRPLIPKAPWCAVLWASRISLPSLSWNRCDGCAGQPAQCTPHTCEPLCNRAGRAQQPARVGNCTHRDWYVSHIVAYRGSCHLCVLVDRGNTCRSSGVRAGCAAGWELDTVFARCVNICCLCGPLN